MCERSRQLRHCRRARAMAETLHTEVLIVGKKLKQLRICTSCHVLTLRRACGWSVRPYRLVG